MCSWTDVMFTIAPPPWPRMCRAAARERRKAPRTSTEKRRSKSSASSSSAGLRLGEAGIVDEHVEPAERLDRLGREPLRHVRVAEVARDPVEGAEPLEALLWFLVLRAGGLRRVPEREAVAEQPLGDCVADPAIRAGNEGDARHGRRDGMRGRLRRRAVEELV